MSFSFGFSGDDIDETITIAPAPAIPAPTSTSASSSFPTFTSSTASAFPIQGKPQLPATYHPLSSLMATLPSKITYNILTVTLDSGEVLELPRRELWDVRVQIMAEDDGEGPSDRVVEGLGSHDVRTGIYEGGFKSWESSVDLIKVLAGDRYGIVGVKGGGKVDKVMEFGCGTALPTLAIFRHALSSRPRTSLTLLLADYNPTVLSLVTLPNLLLTWALHARTTSPVLSSSSVTNVWSIPGELELTDSVKSAFLSVLETAQIRPVFVSGGWSEEFVQVVYGNVEETKGGRTVLMGAETIYSLFALEAYKAVQRRVLQKEGNVVSLVAAKRHYFGVGGSLDDFVSQVQEEGLTAEWLREEKEGVRRGVVEVKL